MSKTRSSETERWLAASLALVAAVTVATCGGGRRVASPPSAVDSAPARSAPLPAVSAAAPEAPAVATASAGPTASVAAAPSKPARWQLPTFYGELSELEAGKAKRHVRVLWYGDSHTAADYWTDEVRRALAQRFGDGGPGFVYLAVRGYRHAEVRRRSDGDWKTEPGVPSRGLRTADGVFGLGGIRMVPRAGATASLELTGKGTESMSWEISYRIADAASAFGVTVADAPKTVVRATEKNRGRIARHRFETGPRGKVELSAVSGSPQLFGAIIERSEPGVVVDTLGINGATVTTPLAWDEAHHEREMARREAALVVLAYGTNETGSPWEAERWAPRFEKLVARLRDVRKDVDCLLVGPTDRVDKQWETMQSAVDIDRVQRGVARKLGCAYFSALGYIRKSGGFREWSQREPPLAAGDRVHLTSEGYARIGKAIATRLLRGYDNR